MLSDWVLSRADLGNYMGMFFLEIPAVLQLIKKLPAVYCCVHKGGN
jgi:hypothetical protein